MEFSTIAMTGINNEIFKKFCEILPIEIVEIIMWKMGGYKCSGIKLREFTLVIKEVDCDKIWNIEYFLSYYKNGNFTKGADYNIRGVVLEEFMGMKHDLQLLGLM